MPVDPAQIELFTLIFIRIASALAVLPVFSHAAFPTMAKAGFAGAMALLLLPTVGTTLPSPGGTLLDFFLLATRETLCGILLGFAGQFLFWAVDIAGQLIGFQAGFSVVSAVDPNTGAQSTIVAQFYNTLAMLIFLSIDGHHLMLRAVTDSLHAVPLGALSLDARLSAWSLGMAQGVLADGIRLAAPLMITLLLADVGLGILSRVAPALNIFVLGFPLKVGITLLMMAMTVTLVATIFTAEYSGFARQFPGFLKLMVAP